MKKFSIKKPNLNAIVDSFLPVFSTVIITVDNHEIEK